MAASSVPQEAAGLQSRQSVTSTQGKRIVTCPECGDEYTRLIKAEMMDGDDSYKTGMGVRGDVLVVSFFAECGSEFSINYGFHKGQTLSWVDVITPCRVNYHAYIQSSEWRTKASVAKEAAGWRCQVCNRPSSEVTLDAHHRTYERLGHELPGDITVLCRNCHELYETNKRLRKVTKEAD